MTPNHDLLTLLYDLIDSRPDMLQVTKVKAHTTQEDREAHTIKASHQAGNAVADRHAGEAARADGGQSHTLDFLHDKHNAYKRLVRRLHQLMSAILMRNSVLRQGAHHTHPHRKAAGAFAPLTELAYATAAEPPMRSIQIHPGPQGRTNMEIFVDSVELEAAEGATTSWVEMWLLYEKRLGLEYKGNAHERTYMELRARATLHQIIIDFRRYFHATAKTRWRQEHLDYLKAVPKPGLRLKPRAIQTNVACFPAWLAVADAEKQHIYQRLHTLVGRRPEGDGRSQLLTKLPLATPPPWHKATAGAEEPLDATAKARCPACQTVAAIPVAQLRAKHRGWPKAFCTQCRQAKRTAKFACVRCDLALLYCKCF